MKYCIVFVERRGYQLITRLYRCDEFDGESRVGVQLSIAAAASKNFTTAE
jgi:hypothetical protein